MVSVISTGNRSNTLTVADSPSPIDIISGDHIRKTGKASLREALGRIVPSFSAPAQSGSGTSNSVRPVSIRGLSGDHVLVRVNGKRRHNTPARCAGTSGWKYRRTAVRHRLSTPTNAATKGYEPPLWQRARPEESNAVEVA